MKSQQPPLDFEGIEKQPLRTFTGEGLPRLLDVRDPGPRAAAARGRAEARAAPHHLRDERARPRGRLQAQEVGAHGRRRDRQVPPARRLRLLRGDGADGAGFLLSLPGRGRAGQLGIDGRPEVLRRDALHGVAPAALRAGAALRARPGHRGLAAELRRHARGAEAPAGAAAERAAERHAGHRGRHGDRHPAAQPARGHRCLRAPARRSRRDGRGALQARARAGLPDRRGDHHAEVGAARDLQDRQRHVPRARRVRDRGRRSRDHGAALPGLGRQGARADRRADAREEAADGRGPARRERPRAPDAPRHHAALQPRGCRAGDGAPVRDHRPRAQLPREHQRHRARRPAARLRAPGAADGMARLSQGDRQAPPALPPRQGDGAAAHPRWHAHRVPEPGRGDPHRPARGRAEAGPHEALQAHATCRRRRSSRPSCATSRSSRR